MLLLPLLPLLLLLRTSGGLPGCSTTAEPSSSRGGFFFVGLLTFRVQHKRPCLGLYLYLFEAFQKHLPYRTTSGQDSFFWLAIFLASSSFSSCSLSCTSFHPFRPRTCTYTCPRVALRPFSIRRPSWNFQRHNKKKQHILSPTCC